MMLKVLVICGPTASGKTSLSVACAKNLQTEIVSADSLLVYKGLDVGTAKPTIEERRGITHHAIDIVSPFESFSVSDYEKYALPIIQRLLDEGKTPIVCGGTGFYINALLYKSQFGNAGADAAVRKKYEDLYQKYGNRYLHELLREKDPESADKLHENDTKRVIRALEIFEVTGKPKSEQHDELTPRFDFRAVSVDFPREQLYERINLRVEEMFENGLLAEVQALLDAGVSLTAQCMQGIGYKEVAEGLQNGVCVAEIKELIKKNTRNYAKRQITFFKRMQNHTYLAPSQATAENVLKLLED